jgi:hypothetical protein
MPFERHDVVCPFCHRLHRLDVELGDEGEPRFNPNRCPCGAWFFFDYMPATQEGLTETYVEDLKTVPSIRGMYAVAQISKRDFK